jgi:phospholipid/cholesterol/gamma-HCH transport system substrate-binding protein
METRTPELRRVVTMVLFALSCTGLLLFLWLSFGGTIPFATQGYRFQVAFPNANQLAAQADVRIAGVSVGKVVGTSLDPQGNRTMATIEMDQKFAPIHQDARAILRQKTILGEAYIELTPGTPNSPPVPDGGMLPRGQVTNAVQLSDILDALDPTTRRAFQVWQQQLAIALRGNGQNLNNVFGNLPAFAADTTDLLQVLNIEHAAVVRLVRNGGTVFSSLSQSQSTLRNLIMSAEATFATTAANNNQLATIVRQFPAFLDESKATFARTAAFAVDANPLVKELEPVAQQLGPTLQAVHTLAPDLQNLFVELGPLVTASKSGLPAISDVLNGAIPVLGSLGPFLEQLNPILNWLSLHQQLTSDFISLGPSAMAGKSTELGGNGVTCNGAPCAHYLPQVALTSLASSPGFATTRGPGSSRGNTYPPSLWGANPLTFSAGGRFTGSFAFASWDCPGGPRPANTSTSTQACWVAPPLPGAKPGQIPRILQANYSSK